MLEPLNTKIYAALAATIALAGCLTALSSSSQNATPHPVKTAVVAVTTVPHKATPPFATPAPQKGDTDGVVGPQPWLYNLVVDGQPVPGYQGTSAAAIDAYEPTMEEELPSTIVITRDFVAVSDVQNCLLLTANQTASPKTGLYQLSVDGGSAKAVIQQSLSNVFTYLLGNGMGEPNFPDPNGWAPILFIMDYSLDPWTANGGPELEAPTEVCLRGLLVTPSPAPTST